MLESLFKKVDGLKEKRLQHRYFPVNIAKVLRTTFLQSASGRLLLLLRETPHYSTFPSMYKKWRFPLRIYWITVTKSERIPTERIIKESYCLICLYTNTRKTYDKGKASNILWISINEVTILRFCKS